MSITIDWVGKEILVPKSYHNPLGGEIYEFDINEFRLDLRDLEDDEIGIPFQITHSHNTTINIGGVTLARVIEIINGYVVTFEDGQYAVNFIGANTNIADVATVNQVSLRPSNSAGLVTSAGIEALEYMNGVTIDVVNGVEGTLYPIGTPRRPVNNLADAKTICTARGFHTLYIEGDFTFQATDNIDGFIIIGDGHVFSTLTFVNGCSTISTVISNVYIQGTLNGGNQDIHDCNIGDLTNFSGHISDCSLTGTIILDGIETVDIFDCKDGYAGLGEPMIDFGGSGRGLNMRGYEGGLRLENKSGNEDVSIGVNGGRIEIASDVTNGEIILRGVGHISSNLGSATVIDDMIAKDDIAREVWDEELTGLTHNIQRSAGKRLRELSDADVIHTGTAQTGGSDYIQLEVTASSVADYYKGYKVVLVGGTGNGQTRRIHDYDSDRKAFVIPDWIDIPDFTSEYEIIADADVILGHISEHGEEHLAEAIRQYSEGNVSYEFIEASVGNATRKVEIGVVDRMIIKYKEEDSVDWSNPIATYTHYYWYSALGDTDPYYVGESD